MLKRGQAAMEFLMTYGWAIIGVLIVLGALFYLGIFSHETSNSYQIQAPLLIEDMIVKDNGILFHISKNLVDEANITDISINGESCYDLGGSLYNTGLGDETFTGCALDMSDYDKVSGNIRVMYTSKGNLIHSIEGSYSGTKEDGSIFDVLERSETEFHLAGEGLVFGWDGSNNIDYVSGLVGILGGGIQAGNAEGYLGTGTKMKSPNEYIQFSNLDLLIGTNPNEFTVSMWVKVEYDTPSTTSTYWGFYNGSTIRTRLWSSGGQTPYFVFQNSSGSNPALSLDSYKPSSNPTAWNHFLIAYDGINITFFRNGVKKSTYVAGESEHIGGYNFKIMYNSPDSNKIAYADEIAIWRRTLTQEEITQLYSLYI